LKDSASGKRYGIRWIGVGQIQDQHLAQFMEDSCELLHTNAQCHKTKRQKCGYINFRNVYRVPGKKSTWCNQGTAAAFKNLGWQNNAWMQANLQAAGKAIHILQMVHSTAMAPQSKLADSR